MTKAIIFDFDGVIALSEESRFRAIQKSSASNGIAIPDITLKKMIGRTTVNFLHDILMNSDKSLIDKIIKDYKKAYEDNIKEYVESIDITVNFIKNYSGSLAFALASMSSRRKIEELTKHFGIYERFKLIICRENVVSHKPDPEIYLKSAQELQLDPVECIVIEDTVIGAKAALNANMSCYVLLNGMNSKDEFVDMPVAGFISTQRDLDMLESKTSNK